MVRRLAAGLLALLLLSTGMPRLASAADTLRIGKSNADTFPFAVLELGREQGIWSSVGLDLDISVLAGDARIQQALAAGSIDIALGSGPSMAYAIKGAPARAVAVIDNQPADLALIALNNNPVKTVADLKGKRVGITTVGSLTDWLVRKISEREGWGSNGIETVALGQLTARYAAMKLNEIQAALTSLADAKRLERSGEGRLLATFGTFVPHFHTHVILASDTLIKDKPDVLRRFIDGWKKTVAFMRSHRAETVKSVSHTTGLDAAITDAVYDDEMAMISADSSFSEQALQTIAQSLKDLGMLDKLPPTQALYQPGFVDVRP
jgi:ABC-type nitrate/sulfonate/bicarbonate transport system substrate-binding protein